MFFYIWVQRALAISNCMNIWEPNYRILLSVTGDNNFTTARSTSFSGGTTRSLVLLSPAGDNRKNWNAFQTPKISYNLGTQTISCCMWCVTRSELVNFWNFRCRKRSKKRPFAALIIESTPNFFFWRISRNQWGFIYLLTEIVQWAKFEAKLFSDAKFPGPLLRRSPLKCFLESGIWNWQLHEVLNGVSR